MPPVQLGQAQPPAACISRAGSRAAGPMRWPPACRPGASWRARAAHAPAGAAGYPAGAAARGLLPEEAAAARLRPERPAHAGRGAVPLAPAAARLRRRRRGPGAHVHRLQRPLRPPRRGARPAPRVRARCLHPRCMPPAALGPCPWRPHAQPDAPSAPAPSAPAAAGSSGGRAAACQRRQVGSERCRCMGLAALAPGGEHREAYRMRLAALAAGGQHSAVSCMHARLVALAPGAQQ